MNWLVGLVLVPKRTSLIFTAGALRTLAVVVSDCGLRVAASVHSALPVKNPAPEAAGEVILKVAFKLAPGDTGSANGLAALTVQPAGSATHSLRPETAAPVVFVKVWVISWEDRGVNV